MINVPIREKYIDDIIRQIWLVKRSKYNPICDYRYR